MLYLIRKAEDVNDVKRDYQIVKNRESNVIKKDRKKEKSNFKVFTHKLQ